MVFHYLLAIPNCYGIFLLNICLNCKTVQITITISWRRPHSPLHKPRGMWRGMWQWEAPPGHPWLLYLSELQNIFVQIVISISWQRPHSPLHMQRGRWQLEVPPSLSSLLTWWNHRQGSQGTWIHPIVTMMIPRSCCHYLTSCLSTPPFSMSSRERNPSESIPT